MDCGSVRSIFELDYGKAGRQKKKRKEKEELSRGTHIARQNPCWLSIVMNRRSDRYVSCGCLVTLDDPRGS